MCLCPRLMKDEEITSYCYPACSDTDTCLTDTMACVKIPPDDAVGVCLESGYWKTAWKAKWCPDDNQQQGGYCITMGQSIPFNVGSISLNFQMSLIWVIEDPEYGLMPLLLYVGQGSTSQWQMQVRIPDALYSQGLIDFNKDCSDALPCDGMLAEIMISGTTATAGYIRAANMPDQAGTNENWFRIDTENRTDKGVNSGELKLFFSEYSAEISVD